MKIKLITSLIGILCILAQFLWFMKDLIQLRTGLFCLGVGLIAIILGAIKIEVPKFTQEQIDRFTELRPAITQEEQDGESGFMLAFGIILISRGIYSIISQIIGP